MTDLEFYFLECHVTHQQQSIFVLENSCYANALGSTPENISRFSFKTFAIESVNEDDVQNVACSIKICSGQNCALQNINDTICPETYFYDWRFETNFCSTGLK